MRYAVLARAMAMTGTLLSGLAWHGAARAVEGMWMPSQLAELTPALKQSGLRATPKQLAQWADPKGDPLGAVVPGWQEGIALMPVGSKFKLWIPAKLGYGEQGTPGGPIGPNATLVFDVELLDIVKADGPESAAMGTTPKH